MKIIKKIFAYFTIKGEKQQMELAAAEIRQKGAFLHPAADPEHTFFVNFDSVGIIINPEGELKEDDIHTVDRKIITNQKNSPSSPRHHISPNRKYGLFSEASYMPIKKRFTIMVYQDEYDMLMENIVKKGYKKAEYFLACVTASKKQSWEKEYKNFTTTHKERYKNDKLAAQQIVAEELKKQKQRAANETNNLFNN